MAAPVGSDSVGSTLTLRRSQYRWTIDKHNGYRRRMALIAFEAGRHDLAEALFAKLLAPMISMCDDETDLAGLGDLVGAVMHHARLCTLLNKRLPSATPSKHSFLHPFQQHASTIGVLLGRVAVGNATVPAGSIQDEARVAWVAVPLSYLCLGRQPTEAICGPHLFVNPHRFERARAGVDRSELQQPLGVALVAFRRLRPAPAVVPNRLGHVSRGLGKAHRTVSQGRSLARDSGPRTRP